MATPQTTEVLFFGRVLREDGGLEPLPQADQVGNFKVGDIENSWEILEVIPGDHHRHRTYRCRCLLCDRKTVRTARQISRHGHHSCPRTQQYKAGDVVGCYEIVAYLGYDAHGQASMFRVRCRRCGELRDRSTAVLVQHRNRNRSCGCIRREGLLNGTRHGEAKRGKWSPEYGVWVSMRQRVKHTVRYVSLGIKVCARWDSFERFLEDVGRKPSPEHSLDRINPLGDYEPSNVRWATREEQARNKASNHLLTANGETLCLRDWARRLEVTDQTVTNWLRSGLTMQDVLDRGGRARRSHREPWLGPQP